MNTMSLLTQQQSLRHISVLMFIQGMSSTTQPGKWPSFETKAWFHMEIKTICTTFAGGCMAFVMCLTKRLPSQVDGLLEGKLAQISTLQKKTTMSTGWPHWCSCLDLSHTSSSKNFCTSQVHLLMSMSHCERKSPGTDLLMHLLKERPISWDGGRPSNNHSISSVHTWIELQNVCWAILY